MISEKDCIVSDDRRLSEIFNEHFINITKTLDLKPSIILTTTSLPEILETFKDHPSINKIFSLQREEWWWYSRWTPLASSLFGHLPYEKIHFMHEKLKQTRKLLTVHYKLLWFFVYSRQLLTFNCYAFQFPVPVY